MPVSSYKDSLLPARRDRMDEKLFLRRVAMLGQADRVLMESAVVRRVSSNALSKKMKLPACTVRRRISRLSRRIVSRAFVETAGALPLLSMRDAMLARMFYCEGLSQPRIARSLGLTPHAVRRQLDRVRGQIHTIWRKRQAADKGAARNGADEGIA